MDVNRISGYIPGKMVFFLMQVMTILDTSAIKSAFHPHRSLITVLLQLRVYGQPSQAQHSVSQGEVAQQFLLGVRSSKIQNKAKLDVRMCHRFARQVWRACARSG